ncbi:1-phosphofructokinase [Clostridium sp. SYSU_GA19001]|uniref:1-phosphofructokinase n=1 Tax=Clostridium caldaquaticum TaxID=2940653 RepID=UPI0020778E57|nr:1-phosphofructokinase [Clostridium caldaquaticum]MCM8710222.1 1-phosphofructokinase [Clostridium caldaquaticum]
MVITVTLNPAVDKTLTIDNFTLGSVNRVSSIRHDIGGKGINVSKVLKNFGIDSICTGFLGGVWEKYFQDELKARGISSKFIKIKESTRTNVKVVDNVNKVYTDINEAGPFIDSIELDEFIKTFESICSKGDIVVLSGGSSPSIPTDIYARLIKIAKLKGAATILDAEGKLLEAGLKEKPDIIKPNIHELSKLMNLQDESEDTIINVSKKLIEDGIEKILVSLGEKGAIYVTKDKVYKCEGLKVPVKSTVGAGDSMVAALVYCVINGLNDVDTLKFANASGAAAVSLEGTEACTISQVEQLINKVDVKLY